MAETRRSATAGSGDLPSLSVGESAGTRAQDLEQAAERATDPAERQRLKDQARRLKEQSEHAGGTGKPD
ncbi:DUF6381 family protein [Streptomyces sp. NBC_00316]|uniref:DUF6381 family protein n=1 Tax=Streptomyces sp. NBC_00316 TaxID=2975710 RepID=UPI003FA73E75